MTAASSLREIGSIPWSRDHVDCSEKGLVVAQVALSIVVLSAAILLIAHVADLRDRDVGFNRDSVLLVTLQSPQSNRSPDELFRVYQDALRRLEAIPGVRSVCLAAITPIQGGAASQFVRVEGFEEEAEARRRVSLNWVSPRYFETVGTPRIEGRDFVVQDEGGPRVAIVNQRLARHYFGEDSAIGRRFTLERGSQSYEIVGVVADAEYASLQEAAPPTIYMNAFQEARGRVSEFALRTDVPPTSLAGDVRCTVGAASSAVNGCQDHDSGGTGRRRDHSGTPDGKTVQRVRRIGCVPRRNWPLRTHVVHRRSPHK